MKTSKSVKEEVNRVLKEVGTPLTSAEIFSKGDYSFLTSKTPKNSVCAFLSTNTGKIYKKIGSKYDLIVEGEVISTEESPLKKKKTSPKKEPEKKEKEQEKEDVKEEIKDPKFIPKKLVSNVSHVETKYMEIWYQDLKIDKNQTRDRYCFYCKDLITIEARVVCSYDNCLNSFHQKCCKDYEQGQKYYCEKHYCLECDTQFQCGKFLKNLPSFECTKCSAAYCSKHKKKTCENCKKFFI